MHALSNGMKPAEPAMGVGPVFLGLGLFCPSELEIEPTPSFFPAPASRVGLMKPSSLTTRVPRWQVRRRAAKAGFGFCLAAAGLVAAVEPAEHAAEIRRWRAQRVDELSRPDGWLALIGLHFLAPGVNAVGSAPENDVVLVAGPARLGNVIVNRSGEVEFTAAPGTGVRIDGRIAEAAVLSADELHPTVVTAESVSFFVIDRGGRKALRVKDSASPRRTAFRGLDYFPIDPSWRIVARWLPFVRSRMMPFANILGQTGPMLVPGKAAFAWQGRDFELLAIDEGPHKPLFFVFADATSGRVTYAASRFLYVERPRDGTLVLDFNRAENPPCAFTPFSTCPLPPRENRLPFAVTAGEKTYRDPLR
jgi:uncharacterized protein (DUF1684 family)